MEEFKLEEMWMLKVRVCMKRESKDVETDGRKKKKRNIKEKRQVRGRRHRGGFLVSEFIFETDPERGTFLLSVYNCTTSCWDSVSSSYISWLLIGHMGKTQLFSMINQGKLINSATRGHMSVRIIKCEGQQTACKGVCVCVPACVWVCVLITRWIYRCQCVRPFIVGVCVAALLGSSQLIWAKIKVTSWLHRERETLLKL